MPATYANGHISATGGPIHFMFGSRVGFSGTADRTALFTVRTNPRWWPPPSWKNFKWPYLRNRSSDPLYVLFYGGVLVDGGSNDAISGSNKSKGWPPPPSWKNFKWHISATSRPIHFMFGYRVEFSGTADLMALFSIRTNSWIIWNGYISTTATYIAHIARSSLR